jgi:DNA-binding beta-propeller fold protein YncE
MRSRPLLIGCLPFLCATLLSLSLVSGAQASRNLLSTKALQAGGASLLPPPDGQIEAACGLAFNPAGQVYLADYYHRVVDRFASPPGPLPLQYLSQIALSGQNPIFATNRLDAVCQLATDAAGNLYANEWHQAVLQLTPGEVLIDDHDSTGLAIDPSSGRLYVDDRAYIAEYELPAAEGAEPLAKIGLGTLHDGYGLAAFAGYLYVADASDQTVKVYHPSTSTGAPVATLTGFNHLTDAALAVDPTNQHLLVLDNLQPGYEHPVAAVEEFGAPADGYPYLGRLPGSPIDAEPAGLAVAPNGMAIVTDGNSELSNAFLYGSYDEASPAGIALPTTPGPSIQSVQLPETVSVEAAPVGGSAAPKFSRPGRHRPQRPRHRRHRHPRHPIHRGRP